MDLPDSTIHAAGIVPGLFLMTPKLTACNIFVAYDSGLHKFFVFRVGGRNPHKPPDLESRIQQAPQEVKKRTAMSDIVKSEHKTVQPARKKTSSARNNFSPDSKNRMTVPMNRFESRFNYK